ncbi:hypothetical protein FALBO_1475 [Fusarium albosuccineum]|uniref:CHAT domain-containing protein n=1 Tax=Fusarium albosuccineum TaxID=1237068 RepID=A0A8H4LPK4_9HYPO|nr:hypothetical protein FALBO_1475 [Fusarium albosuccineum]
MDSASTELKLSLVEKCYNDATQEWTIDVHSSDDQIIGTLNVKSPIDSDEEEHIRWYVEEHALKAPYKIGRAREARELLNRYGNELGQLLQGTIMEAVSAVTLANLGTIRLEVVSQSSTSRFQGLHWELLESANWDIGPNVTTIVTRRIIVLEKESVAPVFGSDKVIRILFVSARPQAEEDVDYRLISRHLVDLAESPQLRGHCIIEFVRPGSWILVDQHLRNHEPGYYSIAHFDVHGSIHENQPYLEFTPIIPELLFDVQEASTIAEALKKAEVELVLLNACNSANAQSTHSNLAQIFVEAGIGTVIAMSYTVLAESAKIFVGQFYESFLHQRMEVDLAAHAARRILDIDPLRQGTFGLMRPIKDGIIPVVYKGYAGSISWKTESTIEPMPWETLHHPPDTSPCIGRDIDILKLEDLLFFKHAVFLYGPAGSGKTSLADHLKDWWVKTGFVQDAHVISCRSFTSFDESTLYHTLGSLIHGKEDSSGGHDDDQAVRRKVLKSSSIVFIDNCETTAGKPGLDHFHLPALNQEEAESLHRFVENVCADKEATCRLVLLSRTDALLAHCVLGPDQRIKNEKIGYYELKNPRPAEAVQIMKGSGDSGSALQDFGDADTKLIFDLIGFHDNNATMASLLAACIRQPEADIVSLDETLQAELPTPLADSLVGLLDSPSEQNASIFSDFAQVMSNIRTTHRDVHRAMLCFALNRNRSLNFPNLSGYLLNLAGWGLLPGCPAAQASKLSWSAARRAARRPEKFHNKIFDHSPSTRYALRDAMKILKVLGLVEEDVTVTSQYYYKLHPLLPYLLRVEILQLKDSVEFSQKLRDSFLDYWHFRASEWTKYGETTIPGFISTEWPNLCCAIELCIQHRSFEKGEIEVLDALKHVLNKGSQTPPKVEKSLKLLFKAISRVETVAEASAHSALDPDLLEKAMTLVRMMLQYLDLSSLHEADDTTSTAIKQSTRLLNASRQAYGEPDIESWCTGIMLDLAQLRYETVADQSQNRCLYGHIWNAVLPKNAENETATLLYNTQFDLLFMLMDRKHLAESCTVNKPMIQEKAKAILDKMGDKLDTTDLELTWSMYQLKHWSDSDIPFDLNGVSQTENIFQMLDQRGFQVNEKDPRFALALAIKYKNDPERSSKILLEALHNAHKDEDREEQRLLHRAFFMFASERGDLETSILHFDEMIRLDYALAARSSISSVLPEAQLHMETLGNIIIADLVIRQYSQRYLSVPGNATPGTSRPPTAASEEHKLLTRSRLSRALRLTVDNNFDDLQCRTHLALGANEAFLEASPNASWAHFVRAASLGDQVNIRNKERFVFGTDLAHGRLMAMLMTVWQFKTASSARDEISDHVAAALGDSWSMAQVRAFFDLTYDGVGIAGARVDHSFFQDPPLNRYFEEAQRILLGQAVDPGSFLFWRNDGSGWTVDGEAACEATMHAFLVGSMRQNPQNWQGYQNVELPERFRNLEL